MGGGGGGGGLKRDDSRVDYICGGSREYPCERGDYDSGNGVRHGESVERGGQTFIGEGSGTHSGGGVEPI